MVDLDHARVPSCSVVVVCAFVVSYARVNQFNVRNACDDSHRWLCISLSLSLVYCCDHSKASFRELGERKKHIPV